MEAAVSLPPPSSLSLMEPTQPGMDGTNSGANELSLELVTTELISLILLGSCLKGNANVNRIDRTFYPSAGRLRAGSLGFRT